MTETLLQELEGIRKSIWMSKPVEVARVKGRQGARGQNYSILVYCEGDTRAIVDTLHCIRVAAKGEGTDLKTLVSVMSAYLEFEASRFERYYDMIDAPAWIRKTISGLKECKDKEEFLKVVEACMLCIGKLNYWIDLEMSWAQLAAEYDRVKSRLVGKK